MWNIIETSLVISKWLLIADKALPKVKSVSLWVHLKEIPLNMFSWKGLNFITSVVGDPIRLHHEIATCSSFEITKD